MILDRGMDSLCKGLKTYRQLFTRATTAQRVTLDHWRLTDVRRAAKSVTDQVLSQLFALPIGAMTGNCFTIARLVIFEHILGAGTSHRHKLARFVDRE